MTRKKVALLFPGQGSQYPGMGQNLSDKSLFLKANSLLNKNLQDLCFQGPKEELNLTENTQPAIFCHSCSLFKEISPIINKSCQVYAALGHSVGEYAALYAANALSFEDGIKIVAKRGRYMQAATPQGIGTMFAILKADEKNIIAACEKANKDSIGPQDLVTPANFNSPKQIVISGGKEACQRALKYLSESENKFRKVELAVSAPFHSPLMAPAEKQLAHELENININPLKTPYIANIDAKIYPENTSPEIIKSNLIKQVCGSVLWSQSINSLPQDILCLEIGPGKVLQGLVKQIRPDLKVLTLDSEKDEVENKLKEFLS